MTSGVMASSCSLAGLTGTFGGCTALRGWLILAERVICMSGMYPSAPLARSWATDEEGAPNGTSRAPRRYGNTGTYSSQEGADQPGTCAASHQRLGQVRRGRGSKFPHHAAHRPD